MSDVCFIKVYINAFIGYLSLAKFHYCTYHKCKKEKTVEIFDGTKSR